MSCSCEQGGSAKEACCCRCGGDDGWIDLLPDMTTLIGGSSFTSEPKTGSAGRTVSMHIERGPELGATATLPVILEQSRDGVTWSVINATESVEPQPGVPMDLKFCVARDLFRIRIDTASDTRTTLRIEARFE